MPIGKAELRLPVAHGARLVALTVLDDAADAGARLGGAERDEDALHDFRVAVRRLRSWIRAFDAELKRSVRAKDRKALKAIAQATNPGRDLEVQLTWLQKAGSGLGRRRREGAAWMTDYLLASRHETDGGLDRIISDDFPTLRASLEERLSTYSQPVRRSHGPQLTLAEAISARIAPHGADLAAALEAVHAVEDEVPAHQARIVAKRLRYLIEPAVPHVKNGRKTLGRLKRLQDGLGSLHDTHVMAHYIGTVLERSAAEEVRRLSAKVLGELVRRRDGEDGDAADGPPLAAPAPRAAMIALAGRLRSDMEKAFKSVQKDWLEGRHQRFGAELVALADRLRTDFVA